MSFDSLLNKEEEEEETVGPTNTDTFYPPRSISSHINEVVCLLDTQ